MNRTKIFFGIIDILLDTISLFNFVVGLILSFSCIRRVASHIYCTLLYKITCDITCAITCDITCDITIQNLDHISRSIYNFDKLYRSYVTLMFIRTNGLSTPPYLLLCIIYNIDWSHVTSRSKNKTLIARTYFKQNSPATPDSALAVV